MFYVLIYKMECFLANLEGVKFKNFFGASLDTKQKNIDFTKNLKVLKSSKLATMIIKTD